MKQASLKILALNLTFVFAATSAHAWLGKSENAQNCVVATNALTQLQDYLATNPEVAQRYISILQSDLEKKGYTLVEETKAYEYYLQANVEFPSGFAAGALLGSHWNVDGNANLLKVNDVQNMNQGLQNDPVYTWKSRQGDNVPTSDSKRINQNPSYTNFMKAAVVLSRTVPAMPDCSDLKAK